jgi:hypothetical protein
MKKINIFLLSSLFTQVLIISSCEKEKTEDWFESSDKVYTIPELKTSIGLSNYQCNDTLKCEGNYVNIIGFIYGHNIFPDDSRFILYSERSLSISEVFNQELIDVRVNKEDKQNIFQYIDSQYGQLSDTSWLKVNIKGSIYGWDMAGNGWCKKSIGIFGKTIKKSN